MALPSAANAPALSSLALEIANGKIDQVRALFAQAGAPAPTIVWSPDPSLHSDRRMRRFVERCDKLGLPGGPVPDCLAIPEMFGPLSEWMMILRYDDQGDLIYDHYGSGITHAYGTDMTSASPRDFPGHIAPFFTAVYAAAGARGERVLTRHQPPKQVFVTSWHRLIVPLEHLDGKISGFIVLNLPENSLRAGLEILPVAVLIVDDGKIVRHANRCAREAFDQARFGPWTRSLFDYAHIDLRLLVPPGDLLVRGRLLQESCRHVCHDQITPYSALVNATLHHGTAFYVITLQPKAE